MKYVVRCHVEDGAEVTHPFRQITFVLDSLNDDTPPAVALAEDVLVALGSGPHSIFSLFGGRVFGEETATPLFYDWVERLPDEMPADIVVRDGRVIAANTPSLHAVSHED